MAHPETDVNQATRPYEPEPADQVEEILAGCLADGDAAAAVETACRERPDLATELRARYAALAAMGLSTPPTHPPVSTADPIPDRLGEFHLQRRIGGGGMGVVYLAEQTTLKRRVALKVIRPELLFFAGARERFAREVAAVARLQHSGIVPIYTFGEQLGIPYYAMERIVGCTLAEVLADLAGRDPASLTEADLLDAVARRAQDGTPDVVTPRRDPDVAIADWATCAVGLARQVAEALEHAHARGVLHRDVKPSNIMITTTGRAMMVDFGLARTEGTARVTRSGYELGSLPYLSPEQIKSPGRETDERSDVYALGVTLYEMLTLSNPFLATDGEQTRQRIMAGQPAAPRRRNRALTWEAETVCLTAMDRDAARRYRNAADLARDLGNVLERRPIVARRPGAWLRARRLVERHPTASVGVFLGTLLVLGLPTAIAVQATRAQAVESRLNAELRGALALADKSLVAAHAAVHKLLTRVAQEDLLAVPRMEGVRRDLLESAVAVFETLRAQAAAAEAALPAGSAARGHDWILRYKTARSLRLIADLRGTFSERAGAERAYRQAIALLKALEPAGDAPAMASAIDLELGICYGNLGKLLSMFSEREAALTLARRGIAHLDRLPDGERARTEATLARVRAATLAGEMLQDLQRGDEARAALCAARECAESSLDAGRRESWPAHDLDRVDSQVGEISTRLGLVEFQAGELPAAEEHYRRGAAILGALLARQPDQPEWRQQLASARANLGILLASVPARVVQAVPELDGACALWQGLAADYPQATILRQNLGRTLHVLGNAQAALGTDPVPTWRRAIAALEPLVKDLPDRHDLKRDLGYSLAAIGNRDLLAGRAAEAEPLLASATDLFDAAVAREPTPFWRSELGALLDNLGIARLQLGETGAALAAVNRAIEQQDAALLGQPVPTRAAVHRRTHQIALAEVLRASRRHADSAAAAEKLPGIASSAWTEWRRAAELVALSARAAVEDGEITDDEREKLVAELGARAVTLLRQARDHGCPDWSSLTAGGAFGVLRSRDDFRALKW